MDFGRPQARCRKVFPDVGALTTAACLGHFNLAQPSCQAGPPSCNAGDEASRNVRAIAFAGSPHGVCALALPVLASSVKELGASQHSQAATTRSYITVAQLNGEKVLEQFAAWSVQGAEVLQR